MTAMVATKEDLSTWDNFQWRRRMEAFGHNDEAVIAAGPGGEAEGIWQVHIQALGLVKELAC